MIGRKQKNTHRFNPSTNIEQLVMTDVPKSIHADVWVGNLWVRIAAGGVDFGYALRGKIENQ